jgi:hypothetical protein
MPLPKDHVQRWLSSIVPKRKPPSPLERAIALISAVDAGGLPLHPGIVNDIAMQLWLDVKVDAPMEVTISRIRRRLSE